MMITFYKTDRQGRLLYYSVNDRQGHLFSPHSFTVNWGPSLSTGREKAYLFDTRSELDRRLQEVISRCIHRGYRVLYSYFREGEYRELRPALRKLEAS